MKGGAAEMWEIALLIALVVLVDALLVWAAVKGALLSLRSRAASWIYRKLWG